MSDLRTAAQQALESLEALQGGCTDSGDGTFEAITVWCPEVIEALRAALAEPDVPETSFGNMAAAVAEPVAYSIGRTLHWHPGRGVDDAQLYAAPAQREPQWVPVAERLPPNGQTVLACYTNRAGRLRRIRAEWVAAKSVESNSEDSDIGVYDEATDTFYDPEGWYERIDNWGDYSAVGVCEGDVTHWMPLPDAPASAPKDVG